MFTAIMLYVLLRLIVVPYREAVIALVLVAASADVILFVTAIVSLLTGGPK